MEELDFDFETAIELEDIRLRCGKTANLSLVVDRLSLALVVAAVGFGFLVNDQGRTTNDAFELLQNRTRHRYRRNHRSLRP